MVAMAASPTPNSTITSTKAHPPYKEMIIRALESLKDRKGSSKKAIAKNIAANYSGLPPTHAALLATHLRRLKRNGIIKMIKHSYKLPSPTATAGGSSIPLTVGPKKRGRPPKNPTPVVQEIVKRKPGRPPKEGNGPGKNLTEKRKPGRPRKGSLNAMPKPKPKSVGAVPGEKRRPGRPKKALAAAVENDGGSNALALVPLPENSFGQVPTSIEDGNVGDGTVTLGERRKRGRPKKEAGSGVQSSMTPKKRRLPPKERDLAAPRVIKSETKRPVGRPRKSLEA